jgi:hypothetical protein
VRVDAVPMMPRAATRRMAHELRRSVAPLGDQFLIGEVYTGAGVWGVDVIRYYLGPDGLDSVFNFPLMWVIRDVVAHESGGVRGDRGDAGGGRPRDGGVGGGDGADPREP